MMPPEAGTAPAIPPAASPCSGLAVIARRADFLRAAQGRRQGTAGFLLQARARGDGSPVLRVGFTCSKKVGNAVTRNFARRRLREVARAVLPRAGHPGWDYVLVGRPGATVTRPFALLLADLEAALAAVHAPPRPPRRGPGAAPPGDSTPPEGGA